jgi:putative nucleotidyltransferase with HDIG domain
MYQDLSTAPYSQPLITATEIRFSEIVSALSVALDITQGHPQGHCMRTALVGMRLAEELHLPPADCSALFYALLLKDLGCSSNAAKISYLFHADDHRVKRSTRMTDWTKPVRCLSHCWSNSAPDGRLWERVLKMLAVMWKGKKAGRRISEIRCERGAEIARMLKLPEATARAIHDLDEHWDGRGTPRGFKGEEISLLGRICGLAQTVEVFFSEHGLPSACDVIEKRRGRWFDPDLVDALLSFRRDAAFWEKLNSDDLIGELGRWEPPDRAMLADDACLDRVAEAFAQVVDAKSPWTYDHSTRVAQISVALAKQFGCSEEVLRDIRRAGLLHDIGKLGVSNLILDKPGKPTDEEFRQIRKHPEYSHRILSQVEAFRRLADVASAHHERLDGRGYHRGIGEAEIHFVTRILTVADVFEAMSAKRPYRDALPWEEIEPIMERDAGPGIDRDCFEALRRWHDTAQIASRVELQMREVERLLKEL